MPVVEAAVLRDLSLLTKPELSGRVWSMPQHIEDWLVLYQVFRGISVKSNPALI